MRRHAAFFAIFSVASAIIMSIGAFFLFMGLLEAWRGHASRWWPTVQGTMLESRVIESTRRTGGLRRGGGSTTEWTPRVRYEYEVEGVRHESERVDFMTRAGGRSAAEQELRGLEAGAPVTVHYDPADPSRAVLRPGNGPWDWIPPLMGLLGLSVPPALFMLARRWIGIEGRAERVSEKEARRRARSPVPADPRDRPAGSRRPGG